MSSRERISLTYINFWFYILNVKYAKVLMSPVDKQRFSLNTEEIRIYGRVEMSVIVIV